MSKPKYYDLLVLPPQDKPVYFIVEREYGDGDSQDFYYESHSCPTNWLRPIHMHFDGDHDPHGLIRYVGTKAADAMPPDERFGPNDRDFAFEEWIASVSGNPAVLRKP